MSLSVALPRLSSRVTVTPRTFYIFLRCASTSAPRLSTKNHEAPTTAAIQIKAEDLPGHPTGFLKYERREKVNWDPRFLGNEYKKLLFKDIAHHEIIWGLWALFGLYVVGLAYTTYISFDKTEIWVDRKSTNEFGERTNQFDWAKIRDNYFKKPTVMWDRTGTTHNRLPIMEAIQDDMLKANRERKMKAMKQKAEA